MDANASPQNVPRVASAWLHLALIAALVILRRPAALFHPQFWAEDGQVFYHDAYTLGWQALLHPLNGYLQLLSRLVAMLCQPFPLAWAPGIYVVFAFMIQLLPPCVLLSQRMDAAFPDHRARLALAYFYAVMPNSYELSINLTNAQWHLAFAAFLIIVAAPAAGALGRVSDMTLLAVSGISGPFSIFLTPFAWFAQRRQPGRGRLIAAGITTTAALMQLVMLLFTVSGKRAITPLGATVAGFNHIFVNQIILGGLLGDRLMTALLAIPAARSFTLSLLLTIGGMALIFTAYRAASMLYQQAALLAAGMLIAALITPVASATKTQWSALAEPGVGLRYFVLPVLVWFATFLVLSHSNAIFLKAIGGCLLVVSMLGIVSGFFYAPWPRTGFSASAARFELAVPGTVMTFQENPPGWQMTLTKH